METSQVEPVVIYINEERKLHMENQLKQFPFSPLFFKGYNPENSASYINYKDEKHPEKDTTLCCTRSHIGALKYFLEHSDKQIALVLEDDVLFSKKFMFKLKYVLDRWQKHESEIDFINIGYLPGDYKSKKNDNFLYWDLYLEGGSLWGTQGYLMKRSVAEEIVAKFDQPNTQQLKIALEAKIKENGKIYCPKYKRLQSDTILSLCWRQAFIKPMLVIESPLFNSSIMPDDSNSNTRGWNKAFKSGALNVDDFDSSCELYLRV
jgi:hypothetical protein